MSLAIVSDFSIQQALSEQKALAFHLSKVFYTLRNGISISNPGPYQIFAAHPYAP